MENAHSDKEVHEARVETTQDGASADSRKHVVENEEVQPTKQPAKGLETEAAISNAPASAVNTMEQPRARVPTVEIALDDDDDDEDGDWIETGRKKRSAHQSAEGHRTGRYGGHRHLHSSGSSANKSSSQLRKGGSRNAESSSEGHKTTRDRSARTRHGTVTLQQKRRPQREASAGTKPSAVPIPSASDSVASHSDASADSAPPAASSKALSSSVNTTHNEHISPKTTGAESAAAAAASSISPPPSSLSSSEASDSADDCKVVIQLLTSVLYIAIQNTSKNAPVFLQFPGL